MRNKGEESKTVPRRRKKTTLYRVEGNSNTPKKGEEKATPPTLEKERAQPPKRGRRRQNHQRTRREKQHHHIGEGESSTTKRTSVPCGSGREQHNPKDGDADNTAQKEEEGETIPQNRRRKHETKNYKKARKNKKHICQFFHFLFLIFPNLVKLESLVRQGDQKHLNI